MVENAVGTAEVKQVELITQLWRVAVHQQHVQRAAEGERAGQIELVVEPRVGAAQFHRHCPVTKHRQVARVGDDTQGI